MKATEFEFLQWFYRSCDFGPAHEDVMQMYHQCFENETGKEIPEGYEEEECEEDIEEKKKE